MLGTLSKAGRMSGQALKWLFSKPGAVQGAPRQMMNALDIAGRLGPDAAFATLHAAQMPGDIGDKLIAGATDFTMSGLTGLAAGRATNSGIVDQLASIGGAYAGMPVADAVMRGKDKLTGGKGMTPYEKLSLEQQEALRQQITEQVMSSYGLLPSVRSQYITDPSTGMGVA